MRRKVGERVNRQQVDPRYRRRLTISPARAHAGAELLCQAQQAEVVDVHFAARGFHPCAIADAVGAMHLGVVDEDIDLAADLFGEFLHAFGIGEVKWHHRDLRQGLDGIEPGGVRSGFPRLGFTGPDQVCTGCGECFDESLAGCAFGVGDEDFAELRVASEFAQLFVVTHVGGLLVRQSCQYGLPGAVEARGDAHAAGRCADIAMQMRDHGHAAVEPD